MGSRRPVPLLLVAGVVLLTIAATVVFAGGDPLVMQHRQLLFVDCPGGAYLGVKRITITSVRLRCARPQAIPPSPTMSPTATASATPDESTPTATETVSPVVTPTATETAVPTVSPTATETAVPTPSPTTTETAAPTASPTATETVPPADTPSPTTTPSATLTPTATPMPEIGVCGEPLDGWHLPVINGCATGHEHGDRPPLWVLNAGYRPSFHGHFNASPVEHIAKHAAMKGFSARMDGVDIYFRVHIFSNVFGREKRYHSYEIWARDPAGGVSHWQGWFNAGDPETGRIPRSQDRGIRPVVLVVDQTSWEQGIRCEQWYLETASWGWDFAWTICNTTTIYYRGENGERDQPSWRVAPDGSLGGTRRLEASWYAFREHPVGAFVATQFGEIVSGMDDPRCAGTTTMHDVIYTNVCLDQFIAPTMQTVAFPGNSRQKTYDTTGVVLPN